MTSSIYFSDQSGTLYSVDPLSSTLAATRIGNMSVVMTDLALSPSGQLYGISFNDIYTIDPATGATTFVTSHSVPGANALFIASNNIAYTASFLGGGIGRIDLSSGTATRLPLSDTQLSSAGDLTMLNGELILATTDQRLVRVDPTTGATLGSVTHGIAELFGITTVGNTLYGVAAGNLWRLDVSTGTSELVSSYPIFSIFGAALSEYGQSGDILEGSDRGEKISGTALDDVLFGFGGKDDLRGGAGNDALLGGSGKDQLSGGKGNDDITGGTGRDVMKGGSGADTFVFLTSSDSSSRAKKADVVKDFGKGDACDLSAIDANLTSLTDDSFVVVKGKPVEAGQIAISFSKGDTTVAINLDGDSAVDMRIIFENVKLKAADFIL
jgi:Ca2+-binding RTX toxin-like protein